MTGNMRNLDDGNSATSANQNAGDELHSSSQARLNILWLKVGGLWPLNTGGRLRSFYLLQALSRWHNVTVVTTHGPADDPEGLKAQLANCRKLHSIPYCPAKKNSARFLFALARSLLSTLPVDLYKNRIPAVKKIVSQLLDSDAYDICIADFLVAMPNLPQQLDIPLLFFEHNVEYMIWQRLEKVQSRVLTRVLLALEWRKMRRYELRCCRRAGMTLAVSKDDQALLSEGAPQGDIVSIATGVDVDYFQPDRTVVELPAEIVFTGSMDWHPNEDAMLYFIDAIWPRILREVPEAATTMVGRNPSRKLRDAADAVGIRLTGTVVDVRPYIAKAAVYVVPLRVGGGTRLKIYEALAMGKAVVSTTIGAEGLPLVDGNHIAIADDPETFAATTVNLIRNQAARESLALNGRELVVQQYSWERVGADFEGYIRELLAREASIRRGRRDCPVTSVPQ
ncbi:glycosyltransferase involved in cell wall biosynthesis [Litorivivens lipolytica]|uniref:Glycosyltransferase involved in cell wall biosynthesis n=1 Tax=Litorivivens lipolytica TaxID=1524264 RepID=A0A7W4W6J6_9GAMM|nr:glycosyltransferase family 4 protein [Litorivivens lipolytica]MBB3047834.1 glycosyltransferase involved in cell wall biosynthesis [Litorivivens lipolytica]